jgi:hypothetical protein
MLGILCFSLAQGLIEIRAMDHDVQEVTAKNFDSVIGKFRDSQVASIFFFKPSDAEKDFITYNEVGKELKNGEDCRAELRGLACFLQGSGCH